MQKDKFNQIINKPEDYVDPGIVGRIYHLDEAQLHSLILMSAETIAEAEENTLDASIKGLQEWADVWDRATRLREETL